MAGLKELSDEELVARYRTDRARSRDAHARFHETADEMRRRDLAPPELEPGSRPDPDAMDEDEAKAELREIQGNINSQQHRKLEILSSIEKSGSWVEPGFLTFPHYVSFNLGVTPYAARKQVELSHRLTDLPATRAALQRGEIGVDVATKIASVAEADSEESLLTVARYATPGALCNVISKVRGALRQLSDEDAAASRRARYLHRFFDEQGDLVLKARLPGPDGKMLDQALLGAQKKLARDEEAVEPSSANAADALVGLASHHLSCKTHGDAPTHQVIVHVDKEVLEAQPGNEPKGALTCELSDGPGISAETARRMFCDTDWQALLLEHGEPLNVGRKQRRPPRRARIALHHLYPTCAWPGCDRSWFTQLHHIDWWVRDEGDTDPKVMTRYCPVHHPYIHEYGHEVRIKDDGSLEHRTPQGKLIPEHPEPLAATGASLEERNAAAGALIDPDTCRGKGERCDTFATESHAGEVLDALPGLWETVGTPGDPDPPGPPGDPPEPPGDPDRFEPPGDPAADSPGSRREAA